MDKKYHIVEELNKSVEPRLWTRATTGKQALQLKYQLEQRYPEKKFKIEIGGK